jgi:hypothetical protein
MTVSCKPPLDNDDDTKNIRIDKKTPLAKAPPKMMNSSNREWAKVGLLIDLPCTSISNTSEIIAATKMYQASQGKNITQMLVFQLF